MDDVLHLLVGLSKVTGRHPEQTGVRPHGGGENVQRHLHVDGYRDLRRQFDGDGPWGTTRVGPSGRISVLPVPFVL